MCAFSGGGTKAPPYGIPRTLARFIELLVRSSNYRKLRVFLSERSELKDLGTIFTA